MAEFLVFYGRRGVNTIIWDADRNPLGVYSGADATEAMQSAAAVHGVMGAFFAVPGTFWGVTPADVPKAFGQRDTLDEKIEGLIEQFSQRLALEQAQGEGQGEIHDGEADDDYPEDDE